MKTSKRFAVLATSAVITALVLAPASAQQSGHKSGKPQAGTMMPGAGMGGQDGMMGKKGMQGPGNMAGRGPMMGQGGMMGGRGMMGRGGMMGGAMMGMMHRNMHRKMMRHMKGMRGFKRAKTFNAQDIARIVNGKLSMRGLTRLKAANVKIKDDKTATADIVSPSGELIAKIRVNRKNGKAAIIE